MCAEQNVFHYEISRMHFCRGCGTNKTCNNCLREIKILAIQAIRAIFPSPFSFVYPMFEELITLTDTDSDTDADFSVLELDR